MALIDALANRNPVPKLVGNDRVIPIFDKNYDWSEDRRVWGKAIPDVITHIEDVWPETAKNLEDKRYCITLGNDNGPRNWSIGDVCQSVLRRTLEEASVEAVKPSSKLDALRLRPAFFFENDKFKSWCMDRKGKQLYELQIEICELAIGKHADKPAWVAALKTQIRSLHESKQAVRLQSFGGDTFEVYNQEKARKLREERDR